MTDTIIVNTPGATTTLVVASPTQATVVPAAATTPVLTVPADVVVVTAPAAPSVLTPAAPPVTVLTAGAQGPAGPQGIAGSGTSITFTADGPISGHRMVRPTTQGKVGYADATDKTQANSVLGMSTGAAADATPVAVQTSGEIIEPSWNWTVDQPVFCGLLGALTQTPPVSPSFQLVIGVATRPTSIALNIKQPILT